MQDFTLPDLGEGLPDADLVQWLVAEGDVVTLNQTLAEVETAKAVVELPSPHAGRIVRLHAQAGDTVDVGSVIVTFDLQNSGMDAGGPDASEPDASPAAEPESSPANDRPSGTVAHDDSDPAPTDDGPVADVTPADETSDDDAPPPTLVGYGAARGSGRRPVRRPRRTPARPAPISTATASAPVSGAAATALAERPRATPPVRAYARDLGVDLAAVPATGAALTRADVDAAARGEASTDAAHTVEVAAAPASVAFASTNTNPTERRTPIRGVRKHTAEAMVRSAFTAPHVTTFHTVDVTASLELVAALREDRALAEPRIGLTAIIAKAVCLALRHHPTLNSSWDERAGEIVEYAHVALGIAAATERGLVVPTIPHADTLTLPALADAVAALTETARAGRTAPERLRDGTFTISNIGVFGVEAGTPILNPGEAGILAVGAVVRRPWEHDGQIALRDVMTLSLSFDHRLVDGEQGARFLVEVARLLEQPARALVLS